MTGRPTIYTPEIAAKLCAEMSDGRSLRSICREDDMPGLSTIFRWLGDEAHEAFREQYAKARESRADALVEDILEIADDSRNDWVEINDPENPGYRVNGEAIQRSRLRVDTRKWVASKMLPKVYGEKLAVGGAEDLPAIKSETLTDTEFARRVAFLLAQGVKEAEK